MKPSKVSLLLALTCLAHTPALHASWLCRLCKKKDSNTSSPSGSLHEAAQSDDIDACKQWLQHGFDVNFRNGYEETPLHYAAEGGHESTCVFLVQQGANIHARNFWQSTPLHYAAEGGHKGTCVYLVEQGADINAEDDRYTPLHYAARGGSKETCVWLLEQGANIHAKDHNGYTPLHHAAGRGQKEICVLLLERGANIDARDKDGYTPLHYAAGEGKKGTCAWLLEQGASIYTKGNNGNVYLCDWFFQYEAGRYPSLKSKETRFHHRRIAISFTTKLGVLNLKPTTNNGKTPLDVTNNDDIKQLFATHEATKIAAYLHTIAHDTPHVITFLVFSFTLGQPWYTYVQR